MSDRGPIFDMLNGDIPVCTLEKSMSKEEIEEMAAALGGYVWKKQRGFIMTISGWDHVKEDLYEIPEAVQFLKVVMDTGFFSLLEVTTSIDIESNPWRDCLCPGLGAFEAWLIATGQLKTGKKDVSKKTFQEFVQWLRAISNVKLQESIKRAEKRGVVPDLPAFTIQNSEIVDTSLNKILNAGKCIVPTGSQRIDPHAPLHWRKK